MKLLSVNDGKKLLAIGGQAEYVDNAGAGSTIQPDILIYDTEKNVWSVSHVKLPNAGTALVGSVFVQAAVVPDGFLKY